MIIETIFDEHDCEMCVHNILAENFPKCPFFEKEEKNEECKNWQLDFDKI